MSERCRVSVMGKKASLGKATKEQKSLIKVDWVTGCSMLINLKKFNNKNIFDKNYFLYFEELDLCNTCYWDNDYWQVDDNDDNAEEIEEYKAHLEIEEYKMGKLDAEN